MKKIVILGSNFAGIDVALRLRKKAKDAEITVVDRKNGTQFYPSMYELVTGKKNIEELEISLEPLYAKKNIAFINEEIISINPEKKQVQTTTRTLNYDILVNTLGAVGNYYNIPGAQEFSHPFKNIEDTLDIKEKLEKITLAGDKTYDIVIAGSGLTGIEVVFEIREYFNETKKNASLSIIEACDDICPWTNIETRYFIKKLMEKEKITVKTGFPIKEVTKDAITSAKGDKLNFNMLIWCAGLKTNPINEKSGIESDNQGIKVDDYLRSIKYAEIFACGDAASKRLDNNIPLPKTAHSALITSRCAADNIVKTLKGKPLKKFSPGRHMPIFIDLGDYGAVMMYKKHIYTRPGFLYHFMKNLIEAYWLYTRRNLL